MKIYPTWVGEGVIDLPDFNDNWTRKVIQRLGYRWSLPIIDNTASVVDYYSKIICEK